MTEETTPQEDNGTYIAEGCYCLVITPANEIQVVVPSVDPNEPLTRGHMLMIGLATKIREEGWADDLITETEDGLSKLKQLVESKAQEDGEAEADG